MHLHLFLLNLDQQVQTTTSETVLPNVTGNQNLLSFVLVPVAENETEKAHSKRQVKSISISSLLNSLTS